MFVSAADFDIFKKNVSYTKRFFWKVHFRFLVKSQGVNNAICHIYITNNFQMNASLVEAFFNSNPFVVVVLLIFSSFFLTFIVFLLIKPLHVSFSFCSIQSYTNADFKICQYFEIFYHQLRKNSILFSRRFYINKRMDFSTRSNFS